MTPGADMKTRIQVDHGMHRARGILRGMLRRNRGGRIRTYLKIPHGRAPGDFRWEPTGMGTREGNAGILAMVDSTGFPRWQISFPELPGG